LDTARDLLDSALTVFRQAGDFRCATRALRAAFNSYVEEGRVGGINLIIALYPAA
jgi:hypothetical protein